MFELPIGYDDWKLRAPEDDRWDYIDDIEDALEAEAEWRDDLEWDRQLMEMQNPYKGKRHG